MSEDPEKHFGVWDGGPDALARDYGTDKNDTLAPDSGLRIIPKAWAAEGFRELVEFNDGFGIVIGDIKHLEDATLQRSTRNRLNFHFRLSGSGAIGVGADTPFPLQRQTMALLLSPDGAEKVEEFYGGEHEQSATIYCKPEFIAERFGDAGVRLPASLRACLDTLPDGPVFASAALSAQMSLAVRALIDNPFQSTLRRVFVEAKALELLVLALAALAEAEQRAQNGDNPIGMRDLQRIEMVRETLERDFLDPPTIAKLARDVGVNEAKLMHIFKQQVGETIFNFTQRLKMERAKQMLETSDISVTEIAFEVGYEYSSNFTTAFRRHFGITPRTAREAMRS